MLFQFHKYQLFIVTYFYLLFLTSIYVFTKGHRNRFNSSSSRANGVASYMNEAKKFYNNQHANTAVGSSLQNETRQPSVTSSGTYALSDNRSFAASRYGGPKKPPFTYTELIEHALQEKGELTVSAIYQWIS